MRVFAQEPSRSEVRNKLGLPVAGCNIDYYPLFLAVSNVFKYFCKSFVVGTYFVARIYVICKGK
jgi:hypothetical protein